MALTLNSAPANIDNSATFNVTTSLVEDNTHVNLRVRAEVYHEGVIKAVVEKPKGLPEFNLADILKSLKRGLKMGRDTGEVLQCGTAGPDLITSWSQDTGSVFDSFASAGNQILVAEASADPTFAVSNNINVVAGELFMIYCQDFTVTGGNAPYFRLVGSTFVHETWAFPEKNKSLIIMPTSSGVMNIRMGRHDGNFNFGATVVCKKITTDRSIIGDNISPYFVVFSEVYENSSGITQIGADKTTGVYRYVNASESNMSDRVLKDSTSLFSCKTLRDAATKWFSVDPMEYWVCFFTEYVDIILNYSTGGGVYTAVNGSCYEGWGTVIINAGEIMSSATTGVLLLITDPNGNAISEVLHIRLDNSDIPERTVLEYDGMGGGKEYLAFEGIKDIQALTSRTYYKGASKVRKVLSIDAVKRQRLETRFKDINSASFLEHLLNSENVKKLSPAYVTKDVTIISDSARIESSDMFVNQIEIEYEG